MLLAEELHRFGDIIFYGMEDTYDNLTLKVTLPIVARRKTLKGASLDAMAANFLLGSQIPIEN